MNTALFLLFVALTLFGIGSLLFAIVARGRRKRHFQRGLVGLGLALVAAVAGTISSPEYRADRAAERVAREAAAVVEAEAAKVQAVADAEAKAAATIVAAKAAEDRAAAEASAAAEAEKACRAFAPCWGERVQVDASIACENAVERLGKFSVRWTDGMLEPKFPRVVWADEEAGTLYFGGDKIEFQNGFGAWQPHIYACKFDPATLQVLEVGAEPGRF